MNKDDKTISFDDQDFWIGIDVHHRHWTVTIRSASLEIKTMNMPPKSTVLNDYMNRNYPKGHYHSVYEAGFSGFCAHRELVAMGIDNCVVHPADVPTSNKEHYQKDDPRDSRKLARELESHTLVPIYVPEPAMEELRSLSRLRERSQSHLTRLKNRIKGMLKYYGIQMEEDSAYRHWSGAFLARLHTLCADPGPRSDYLALTLEALEQEGQRMATILRRMRHYCREQAEAARMIDLLRTVPGIGPKIAFTLYTELQDISRFPSLDHLGSYVGLIPSTFDSGQTNKTGGITPRCHHHVRYQLIQAAWIAVRHDRGLLLDFSRLASRMKKQEAIVRIAKKLLARVAYVWRTGNPYQQLV